ncbi:MAG: hypothetical protein KatS3mg131_2320 [Candidatus Tectimicrobiota bacterium]|nr:MAG: hypothetical protein KatS3mg131_2320 [Candidatus Tectomicrobia bacterium]
MDRLPTIWRHTPHWAAASLAVQLALGAGVTLGLPLLFFRHARGLWLGLDYLCDPDEEAFYE